MTWRSPSWFILIVPVLAAAVYLFWRSKAATPEGRSLFRMIPAEGRWAIRSSARAARRCPWLLILAGFFSVLALAGPQWGQSPRELLRPSSDLIIALDLSRSMTVADPAPSRLDRAKLLIRTFLQEATGQRIGLLVFSNSAQLAVPLTTDYRAVEEVLGELSPASLPEAGTDFTALVDEACDAFSQSDAAHRILLILSDGEDHGSAGKEKLARLIGEGVHAYAIGLGTDRGGLVPDPRGGFLKDVGGHPVLSRLQPTTLRALASATGGKYFRGDRWVSLSEILGSSSTADASRLEKTLGRTERFALFLLPAILFWSASLLLEFPTFRSPSRLGSFLRPAAPRSQRSLAFFLGLAGALTQICSPPVHSAPSLAHAREAKDPLVARVQDLAGKDRLSASDYGALARETIDWCRNQQTDLPAGVVLDGLAAVDQGERLDPRLFPWEEMRRDLQEFLKSAHPPDEGKEGGSSSPSQNRGRSSQNSFRYRPSPAARPAQASANGLGSSSKEYVGKERSSPPSSAPVPSPPAVEGKPPSHATPSEAENGARARLRQVERLDRPALLFERMRQREAEQADAPPEPMDW